MTNERMKELECGKEDKLTREEIKNGWVFCIDCDGLLINTKTHPCPCLDKINGKWSELISKTL